MDTDRFQAKIYIERLRQAVRVMEGLSEADRALFNIDIWAALRGSGVAACVAGHCGLDPWFQAEGLRTIAGGPEPHDVGTVYPHPIEFFGTEAAFYRHTYGPELRERGITVDDAIAALKKAIYEFATSSSCELTAT